MNKQRKKKKAVPFSSRASFITEIFTQMPGNKFTLKELAAASGGGGKKGCKIVREILDQMLEVNFIEKLQGGRFRLSRTRCEHFEGTATITNGGLIFVQADDFDEDVFVNLRNGANVLNGDRVEFIITRREEGKNPEGEITRIIERSRKSYVGVAEVQPHTVFVRCDSRRIPVDIFVPRKDCPQIQNGDKVVVRIVEWREGSKSPVGEIVSVLGREGDNDVEMHAILTEFDLPYRFPEEVEQAADAIPEGIADEEIASRRDMRKATTFTIDPAEAKDFDDALSIDPKGDGVWEIGVHIADVTHYVTEDSILETEARERATSVYLVDRTVPMLPERLSNGLCSLRPGEDRLAFSVVFTIDRNLNIIDKWFGRTVIRSDRRFAYEEAQKVIETGEGDMRDELLTLNDMAQRMRAERLRLGAIAFDRREAHFTLDEKGRPTGIYFKEQKEANQLIEEFMLLANRSVAEFCGRKISRSGRKVPRTMIYRVHDRPDEEKLGRFRTFILRFGHIFKAERGRAVARELNALLQKVKGSTEENAVSILAVRTMSKAYYSTDNIGHYGLAFKYYTHFTSPIRRYPDMMAHRLLAHYLADGGKVDKDALEQRCVHSSEREIAAAEAERASVKYKMVEYMRDRQGEVFDAHISGLYDWGMYAELEDSLIEGSIHFRNVESDFYRFDEARYEVYGVRTHRTFTLGTPVKVKVRAADLRRRILDFDLADE